MTGIDIAIVNVALPSIAASLHAPLSSLQGTVDAYTLVIACLLVLSGSLAVLAVVQARGGTGGARRDQTM